MAVIILPKPVAAKPPSGYTRYSGPYSGLTSFWDFNDGSALPQNRFPKVVSGTPGVSGVSYSVGLFGQALKNASVSDYFGTGLQNYATTSGSILWTVYPNFSPTDSVQRFFWGAQKPPGIVPEFTAQKYSDNNWYVGWNNASGDFRVSLAASSANLDQNNFQTYVFTWGLAGSAFYRNGILLGTNGTAPVTTFPIGSNGFAINTADNQVGFGLPSGGATAMFGIWDRALTKEEAISLSDNPYLIYGLQSPHSRYWTTGVSETSTLSLYWQGVDIQG